MASPPGPGSPVLLQTLQWLKRPYAYSEECLQRYGDPFVLRLGILGFEKWHQALVMCSDPAAIKDIFTTHAKHLSASQGNEILRPFLGDHSLLLLDGEEHLRHRRLLLPPFHGDRMKAYGNVIQEVTQRLTQHWKPGMRLESSQFSQEISLEVILHAVFGLESGPQFDAIKRALLGILAQLSGALLFFPVIQRNFGGIGPWARFQRAAQEVEALVREEIRTRRREGNTEKEDILSLMLSARDEDGQPMHEDELFGELLTLLVAGHETTASSLAWALYWLHANPEVCERLVSEIDGVSKGTSEDSASGKPDEWARLPYLEAVCKETLRLYPIIPIVVRRVLEPIELLGLRMEKGTFVAPSIYLTHHRPDLYPEPHTFRPERFLERKFSPYEYLPFGGGVRRCIGMAFAMYEMKIVLATLLRDFRFQLATQKVLRPERRNITMGPEDGTPILVSEIRAKTA